ncbi:cyclin-F [Aplysia californica]|uniref:Cyclin-F n=1 Tax=Aplysia californica TaxID=6500 RepID=A0ABM1A3A9_APLCA|nr:cyclin-F [Aplysia californica]
MKVLKSLSGVSVRLYPWNEKNSQPVMRAAQKDSATADSHKPRTRSTVTIWSLPETVLVHILKGLHIRDLFSLQCAHSNFRDVVDNNKSVWAHISFSESWPNEENLHHFARASELGNFEATIKLAVAYLYKEGLTNEDVPSIGQAAAEYLGRAENLTPNTFPFFWIFIRPPWSPDGSCCKIQAFHHLKTLVDETEDKDLAFGVALTLKLLRLSLQVESKEGEEKYFKMAVENQSAAAAFFSLLDCFSDEPDKAKELERIRLLRFIASKDILEARLNLIKCYTQGQYGGISNLRAREYVQDFFKSSKPSGIHITFASGKTSDFSRYILVDWLVEVVGMKDFSAHTLYLAVSMFDRYLQVRKIPRSHVQLLGVAAMVISSRFLGFDILTIREAAWLTDNSYSYHDVVKMMGELVAALRGNIRVLTIQDYVKVLVAIVKETGYAAMLVEYIAMLCLLQSEMGQYSSAEIASSCVLLSRLLLNHVDPWPSELQEWTGFTQDYLSLCTFHIHKKCLQEGSEVEYRESKLQAVKIRYGDINRYGVSDIEVTGHKELCRRLGVTRLVSHGKNTKAIKFRNTDELIMSPRRGKGSDYPQRTCSSPEKRYVDRNQAATPPIKNSYVLEEGFSGYEGDLDADLDECFSDRSDVLNEESDLERSNLAETSDESKDWDPEESSLIEEEPDESRDMSGIDVKCPTNNADDHDDAEREIVCLSSMCHSRNNVNCRSASSSPSSCICNCSCKSGYSAISNTQGNEESPKLLSFSSASASILSDSSSPSSSSLSPGVPGIIQNVRHCIPSGSIRQSSKSSRRGRGNVPKTLCDISFHEKHIKHVDNVVDDLESGPSSSPRNKAKLLVNCKSTQDFSTFDAVGPVKAEKIEVPTDERITHGLAPSKSDLVQLPAPGHPRVSCSTPAWAEYSTPDSEHTAPRQGDLSTACWQGKAGPDKSESSPALSSSSSLPGLPCEQSPRQKCQGFTHVAHKSTPHLSGFRHGCVELHPCDKSVHLGVSDICGHLLDSRVEGGTCGDHSGVCSALALPCGSGLSGGVSSETPETSVKPHSSCLSFDKYSCHSGRVVSSRVPNGDEGATECVTSPKRLSKRVKLDYSHPSVTYVSKAQKPLPGCVNSASCDTVEGVHNTSTRAVDCERNEQNDICMQRKRKGSISSHVYY